MIGVPDDKLGKSGVAFIELKEKEKLLRRKK